MKGENRKLHQPFVKSSLGCHRTPRKNVSNGKAEEDDADDRILAIGSEKENDKKEKKKEGANK